MADTVQPNKRYYRAREAFACPTRDGSVQVVTEGTLLAEDDPLYRAHRTCFTAVADYVDQSGNPSDVVLEHATAAPGEKRHVRPTLRQQTRKDPSDASPPPA